MLQVPGILVSPRWLRLALAASMACSLAACGQKGALFLPTGPAAAERATLTETLRPGAASAAPASAPAATGTTSPVRAP